MQKIPASNQVFLTQIPVLPGECPSSRLKFKINTMRRLKIGSRGEVSLTTDLISDVPDYAFLSRILGADDDHYN